MDISGNIFEENDLAEQSVLPRTTYNIEGQTDSHVNAGIVTLLNHILEGQKAFQNQILEGQKSIQNRLDKLEGAINIVTHNQQSLSNGLLTINKNVLKFEKQMVEDITLLKAENMAQAKFLMENKVAIKRVQESFCRMTGETSDKAVDEIASLIPFRNIEAVKEVEEKLVSDDFVKAMTTYVQKVKGISEDVGDVIRTIFADDLLESYNYDGRWEKRPLENLKILQIMKDVFQGQGSLRFEKDARKAIEKAHHRVKQRRYLQSKKTANQNQKEIKNS